MVRWCGSEGVTRRRRRRRAGRQGGGKPLDFCRSPDAITRRPWRSTAPTRLDSIDFVRGLVMVIMALDHVREFFHLDARLFEPTDLIRTTPLLFLTRWITHLCAPSFVFLAGTGAYLWASRGRSQAELTRFLVSRGLWLVVVELSLVTVGWTFNFTWSAIGLQVIWAIGWSMVVLAALARLPIRVVGAIGVVMIAGHNLLDAIHVKPLAVADRLSPDASAWDSGGRWARPGPLPRLRRARGRESGRGERCSRGTGPGRRPRRTAPLGRKPGPPGRAA